MPDSWDPNIYRQRAEAWRQRAALLEDEDQQDTCLDIADGHDRLAGLIEAEAQGFRTPQGNLESPLPGPEA
jgi:hypothetical protein